MGLLDGLNMNDPQTLGLLGAAAQMLQASGPSLMPRSFGQVMGAGLQGLQQGQQTGIDRQKEKMQLDMLQQQFLQAQRRNTMIDNWLQGKNPDGTSGQPQPQQFDPVSTGLSQGGSVGDVGPTLTNLARVQDAAANTPVQSPVSTPSTQFGGLPRDVVMSDLTFGNGANLSKFINERSAPTDMVKNAQQLGIPLSTVRDSQLADMNTKGVMNVRPEGTLWKNGKPIFTAPSASGQFTTWDDQGNPTSTIVPNAANVTQTLERAKAAGKASVTPMTAFDEQGNPIFTNQLDAATGGRSVVSTIPPWTGGKLSDGDLAKIKAGAAAGDPNSQMVLASYSAAQGSAPASRISPQLRPGVEKSIIGSVDTMNKDFEDLQAANKSAPTTLRLLENIKKLAPQAIAGSQSDKLAYVNGLLTLGGLTGAKDLATATDLLNKNANMLAINMRLGANGGGSDALQSLAQAANPNAHMQPDAVIKAADEVIGQVKMRQDQYQKLLPYRLKNDYQGYFNTQNDFLKGADPHNYQPAPAKTMSLSDIAATARASGKSTAEVTAAAKAAGYTIGGQ